MKQWQALHIHEDWKKQINMCFEQTEWNSEQFIINIERKLDICLVWDNYMAVTPKTAMFWNEIQYMIPV